MSCIDQLLEAHNGIHKLSKKHGESKSLPRGLVFAQNDRWRVGNILQAADFVFDAADHLQPPNEKAWPLANDAVARSVRKWKAGQGQHPIRWRNDDHRKRVSE